MSQIYKAVTSGSLPPSVPTSFVTDDGTVVPAVNIVNLNGGSTTENNVNGIQVIANPNLSNNAEFQLTNRQEGSVTTTDATPTTLISFAAAATPVVYNFEARVAGFNTTDIAGGAYVVIAGARTTGAAATVFISPEFTVVEEANMAASDIDIVASGNNIIVQVTGIAGKTINWSGTLTYVQVV